MRPGENANVVLAFFRTDEPRTGTGWGAIGGGKRQLGGQPRHLRRRECAWMSSDLSQYDEQRFLTGSAPS